MKKIFTLAILMVILGCTITFRDSILKVIDQYLHPNNITTLEHKNAYFRDYDFNFVQNTTNLQPNTKQELLNIYYSFINAGNDNFTFYCPASYKDCLNDVKNLANDQDTLSDINNFVHPFNSFTNIETQYDSMGRVTISLTSAYAEEEIELIKAKVDQLATTLINPEATDIDNIKIIHDYIINNTIYDSDRSDKNIIAYKSNIAYGPLFQGYGICGGYTDTMELFLEKMGIKSFKVSSQNHIWNAVYLNGNWYHLDLTWDDPVIKNANGPTHILEHDFFLIKTNELLSMEQTEHQFNQNVYTELKEA